MLPKEDYQPSLSNYKKDTLESLDLEDLSLVKAILFGGLVTAIILCNLNAIGLKVNKKVMKYFMCIGVGLLLLYVGVFAWGLEVLNEDQTTSLVLFAWAFGFIYYIIYNKFLKPAYMRFILLGGESSKKIIMPIFLWSLVGRIIEIFFIQGGRWLFKSVF